MMSFTDADGKQPSITSFFGAPTPDKEKESKSGGGVKTRGSAKKAKR